jgi:tetratricopeptide (TPR) repeat protein
VVLRSVNGNELTLNPGVRAQINDVTDAGERYTVVQGVVEFVVNRALNFFDVVFEEFQASVRGTRFTVEIVPGEVYRCTVDHGALMVRRPRIFAIQEGEQAVRVAMQQVRSLGGGMGRSVDWTQRSLQADQTFASFREARAQIEGQLQRALSDPAAREELPIVSSNLLQVAAAEGQLLSALGRLEGVRQRVVPTRREGTGAPARRIRDPVAARFLLALGQGYAQADLPDAALGAFKQAQGLLPDLHPEFAHATALIGHAYQQQLKFDQAIAAYVQARAVYNKTFTPERSQEVARVVGAMSDAYAAQGKLPEAQKLAGTASEIAIALYPERNNVLVADTYLRVGKLAVRSGGVEASRYLDAALQVYSGLQPEAVHPGIAEVYREQGALALQRKQYPEAAERYQRAIEVQRKLDPRGTSPLLRQDQEALDRAVRGDRLRQREFERVPEMQRLPQLERQPNRYER